MSKFSDQLRAELSRCNLGHSKAEDMAELFNISTSTLRQRLTAEGLTFKELLEGERKKRCEAMLHPSASGKLISYKLGYKEQNSFYRAFHRWYGRGFGGVRRELEWRR